MRRSALYLLAVGVALATPVWLQLTLSSKAEAEPAAAQRSAAPATLVLPPPVPRVMQEPPSKEAVRRAMRPRKAASSHRTTSVSHARPAHAEPAVLIAAQPQAPVRAAPAPAPVRAAPAPARPSPPAEPDEPSGGRGGAAGATPPPTAPEAPKQGDVGAPPARPADAKPEQPAPPAPAQAGDDASDADDDAVPGAAPSEAGVAGMSEEELSQWVDDLIESSIGDLSELDEG